ncbi:MAG: hypothetical protein KBD47_02785 [Candidatus Pacebacteria bacterium]|nr:hypothetical protein [Candidatus Paceibacterota bacterium]
MDEFDRYIERLLNAQYDASESLKHELTKGQVRERFIRQQISDQFGGSFICVSGVMRLLQNQYKQCDMAIVPHKVRRRGIGEEYLIEPSDTVLIADVKSTLCLKDMREWNDLSDQIHKVCKDKSPQVGIVAYRYPSDTKNILKAFGYRFDSSLEGYFYDQKLKLQYPKLDFLLLLHNIEDSEDKRLLVRRNPKPRGRTPQDYRPFISFQGDHATKQFWEMLRSMTDTLFKSE